MESCDHMDFSCHIIVAKLKYKDIYTVRFSFFDKFGARNSAPVFAAFARGLDRHGVSRSHHDLSADVAVIWSVVWAGRMQANQAVWRHYRRQDRPVVVLEVGMLRRDHTWKIGINGTGFTSRFCTDLDPRRAQTLGINLAPWHTTGTNIVICAQRGDSEQWAGQPAVSTWLDQTVAHIRSVSDRPIVIRPHPRQPAHCPIGTQLMRPARVPGTYDGYDLEGALAQAWCVVNWNSGPGCQAIIQGVPAFTGPDSMAAPVSTQAWTQIESPARPNREQWFLDLCHTEWTLPEIESGVMLDQLLARIKSL